MSIRCIMKRVFVGSALMAFVSALLAGCGSPDTAPLAGGTGAGNPGGITAFRITAVKDSGSSSLKKTLAPDDLRTRDEDSTEIVIDTGSIRIESIRFALLDTTTNGIPDIPTDSDIRHEAGALVVDGPWVFNLMTGSSSPEISHIPLPPGTYTAVTLTLVTPQTESQEGSALFFDGTIVTSLEKYLLRYISLPATATVTITPHSPLVLGSNERISMDIHLHVDNWFDNISFALLLKNNCFLNMLPFIEIDHDFLCNNEAVGEIIGQNILESATLHVTETSP